MLTKKREQLMHDVVNDWRIQIDEKIKDAEINSQRIIEVRS